MTAPSTRPMRRPTHGPAAHLLALPDSSDVPPTALDRVDAYLSQVEAARQRQLDALAQVDLDVVAVAHRRTVEGILAQVRSARRGLAAGRHGLCAGCDDRIQAERLESQPWVTTCTRCASLARH